MMKTESQSIQKTKPSNKKKNIEAIYPLSPLQQGLLFHSTLDPKSGAYIEQLECVLSGNPNISNFHQAWQQTVDQHPVLRTGFFTKTAEKPVQIVSRQVNLPIDIQDWRDLSIEEQNQQWKKLLAEDRRRGFKLSTPPLMRLSLVRIAEDSYRFLWSHHHILLDGWSLALVLKEVLSRYKSLCKGRNLHVQPPRSYREYIAWLQHQDMNAAKQYWREQLAGFSAPTPLTVDSDLSDQPSGYNEETLQLSVENTTALQAHAKQQQLTLNTLVQGAWALLLSKYSGEQDIVFGVTTAGRPTELVGVESMVGLFINTLPVRVRSAPDTRLPDWLKDLQAQNATLRQYDYAPLVEVQQWSDIPGGKPLFESIFAFENYPLDSALREQNSVSFEIQSLTMHEQTNYPLGLVVVPGDELSLRFIYDQQRFDSATIKLMSGHLSTLLDGMLDNPQVRLSELPLLTGAEQQQILVDWNTTQTDFPHDQCIHQLFEAQVEKTPEAIAAVFEGQSLTYAELNERANQLAHYLHNLGVGSDVLVGICVERSLEMVVGLFGILKAGGAYVPLDPSYPKERLAFMIDDAKSPVLITQKALLTTLPGNSSKLVCLDRDWHKISGSSERNPAYWVQTEQLAYVIYTSGSTGRPKGSGSTHANVINLLEDFQDLQPIGASDKGSLWTSLSFDVSVWEIFSVLCYGAELDITPENIRLPNEVFLDWLMIQGVTSTYIPPFMVNDYAVRLEQNEKQSVLRRLLVGVEPISVAVLASILSAKTGLIIINGYGPTEATVCATRFPSFDLGSIRSERTPIGRPIQNSQVYLIDFDYNLVPVGVPGELCLSGKCLGQGYLNHPTLTAEKFIPNPFSDTPGERLYKTGDLARYLPDGNIEFLGRIDHQVKIRGFRIELGEIESALGQQPSVQETVVVVREDSLGDKRLVAYVVVSSDRELDVSVLREFLKDKLPDYMVPAAFVFLEALPLTLNGKVDRKALPAPEGRMKLGQDYIAPRTPTEELLAEIWAQVLVVERVGIHDNYFELGGHSLLATQVVSRIRDTCQVELPLRTLFEAPTVVDLAHAVETARLANEELHAPPIEPVSRQGDLPLSFAQQRLWFLDHLEPNSPFYNIPMAVRLQGILEVEALEYSLNTIIERHEALRTTFRTVKGQAAQVIVPSLTLDVPVIDLRHLPVTEQESNAFELSSEEAKRPFDLARGPLVRAQLLQLADQDHILQVTVHHIVADGWSIGVFVDELAALYRASLSGQPYPLSPLPIQYADFAYWQRQWLQGEALEKQLDYWKQQLNNLPAVLEIPTDRPRPVMQTFNGAHHPVTISPELTQALRGLSHQAGATLFMTLLTAFQVLLSRYTGQKDFAVGSPIANRNRAETEGLIGFFVNTLVLRANLADQPTFETLLARTKDTTLGAYAHQDLPFEQLVDALQPERDMSHSPLFQVMFALQNAPLRALTLPGLQLTPWELESGIAKFDLTLNLAEEDHEIKGTFEYNTDLFDATTIDRLARHFTTLLEGITQAPDTRVSELPLLSSAEQQQILVDWNATQTNFPHDQCIHQLFETQVEKTPEATAVVFEDQSLTYAELNARANQLAHHLHSLGVGPDVLVGICVERSLEMIVGLLGILKASGAYVPLDPAYPRERLAFMIEDAKVSMLVTQNAFVKSLSKSEANIVCLDTEWDKISVQSNANPSSLTLSDHRAYVIYTSGSTGRPKGIQISHRALANFLLTMEDKPGISNDDIVVAVTTISFDISTLEIFLPLITGAQTIIIGRNSALDGNQLLDILSDSHATVMQATPATWGLLLESGWQEPTSIKVLCGGEALTPQLAMQLRQTASALWNMYGPTETTVWSSIYNIESKQNLIPIGTPVANTQIYILDVDLNPVPICVAGELHIGGMGLARGYLNRAELTAEKFIPNPFSDTPGERLYKTGDLARYLPDGNIECLGRIDYQVKIRGFRIELGEIEAILGQHPDLQEVVVVAREDKPGDKRLVAYVVTSSDSELDVSTLREFLKDKLPDYMVPTAFVFLEQLPLTPNGKVDRKALPAPEGRMELGQEYIAPRTPTEELLAEIWAEVLGVEKVGIQDNFFDLGGHSLLVLRLNSLIEQRLGRANLPVATLFHNPTISQLAAVIDQPAEPLAGSPLVPINPQGSSQLLFCVPGAEGLALSLQSLARHLGREQSFYGLQAMGLDGVSAPMTRVEDMATFYIEAIKTIQPKGPYMLAGYSFGGWVAFEMARLLQAQGEEVSQLYLIDTTAPNDPDSSGYVMNDTELMASIFRLLERLWDIDLSINYDDLVTLSPEQQVEYLHNKLENTEVMPGYFSKTQLRGLLQVIQTNSRMRYLPQHKYPKGLTLFRAIESRPEDVANMEDSEHLNGPDLGWESWCEGSVEVQFVPGDHNTMMVEPNVRVLAEKLTNLLKLASKTQAA